MSDVSEAGRDAYPKGGYVPGMFADVKSVDDFAALLGVPRDSIALVTPKMQPCKSDGCPFNAIARNGDRCPAHQRSWYPLSDHRGGDLLGPEFLRPLGTPRHRTCDCNQQACLSTGYFLSQDALYIPKSGFLTASKSPGLLDDAQKAKIKDNSLNKLYLYAWHFFPWDLERGSDGKWSLKYDKKVKRKKYYDKERVAYDFPPPRNIPTEFLESEYFSPSYVRPQDRWAEENSRSKMPTWMLNMLAIDGASAADKSDRKSIADLQREVEMWKARARYTLEERGQLEEYHDARLAEIQRKYSKLAAEKDATIKTQEEQLTQLEKEKIEAEGRFAREQLKQCSETKARPLRYSDLRGDGILSKHVDAFTLFATYEQNEAFLELLNYADGSPGAFPVGDGMCEHLRPYSKVSPEERSGEEDPPSMDPDSKEYKEHIRRSNASREGGLSWKDDYLAFCLYLRCGLTMVAVASLVGIKSESRMSDILHAWAQILDDALCEMFPRPTRSQMLQAYPTRFIEQDGHARCFLLLDAFEIFAQSSSNYNVASSTHSDYKKHCTVKFLGGTDPIGCPWGATVPDGNPGKASDVLMTADTQILRQVPFGYNAKVDKGFLVDNEAAGEGVVVDRPQKRARKQVQQSTVDTTQTQKIGNTRIIVENVNGEMKLQIRYLNVLIPCNQFPIISKLVRIGYLLQNFKKAIVQRRDPSDSEVSSDRPCRAEIRWYGATDSGLKDVRPDVRLWGLNCEIKLHAELSAEHPDKTPTEISEMVLDRRLDLQMRKELYREVRNKEYDGGDL